MRVIFHSKWALAIVMFAAAGCSNAAIPSIHSPVRSVSGQAAHAKPDLGAPVHVLTWLTIGEDGGTYKVTPSQVAKWVDYTMTTQPLSVEAKLAGMHTLIYSDPNRVNPLSLIWNHDESTFAHDCSGKRITVSDSPDYQMDVHSSHLWSLWDDDVTTRMQGNGGGEFDYAFEDSADEINPQRLSAIPCDFVQQDWTNHTNAMDAQFPYPIFYNGLGLIPAGQASPGPEIGLNATTKGGMSEDCYVGRTPTGYFYAPHWMATANTEIQMAQAGKLFACHSDAYVDASQNTALRTYFYASFLLTYRLSDQMVLTEFLTPSGVTVMPEVQFVPEAAVIPTPSDISGLLQSSGVYGRRYYACYLAGSLIGPCAVAVNPNNPKQSQPLAFPWPGRYGHTLTMSGYGAYDGGTVSTNGPAPPAMLPGGTGVIAIH